MRGSRDRESVRPGAPARDAPGTGSIGPEHLDEGPMNASLVQPYLTYRRLNVKYGCMLRDRPHWRSRLETAWKRAPIVWLAGVRRVGKTVLAESLDDTEFLNCDLPRTARRLADPESFLESVDAATIVFDEIHQLPDPSRMLKIAADAFPDLRILATGSSTLAATRKFSDTLSGRKRTVEILPVLMEELQAFGLRRLDDRLLRGGLPPALLEKVRDDEFYSEWLDSYFARDVQELFHLRARTGFLKFVEVVLRQSGGLLEITSLSKHAGASRPTIMSWLEVLEATHVAHLVRPFAGGGRREILGQPKLYAFDTGFVCHARGWDELRDEDRGGLWEHLVLDQLLSIPITRVQTWRDKQQREVDFVVARGRKRVDAIECKWNVDAFDPRSLRVFREHYPAGRNLLVTPGIEKAYERRYGDLVVTICSVPRLEAAPE